VLSTAEIRDSFIDYFRQHDHQFVPSSPVVPAGDETLLFANAGMNQFKDIFLGLTSSDYKRAVNSQKCIRVSGKHNDLEEVGVDTYHHTFFEMLGNWSFNDYFKAESIEWAWELLTKVWGIEADKLWATVFAGDEKEGLERDDETARLWRKVTAIPPERILSFGKKDNFWEMGDVGPCGPCSEIHIDLGPQRCEKKELSSHKCGVNSGCGRFIELWNLVFIQYNRDETGRLEPLGANYVDTGLGLERIAAVMQHKASNYDTDLFMSLIKAIEKITGHKYTSQLGNETDNAFRVISDHIRALCFAITDGAVPSNEGRGYVVRRILRRAARFGRVLGMHEPFMYVLVPVLVGIMGDAFGEIRERVDYVSTVIEAEEAGFGRTLDRGIEIFASAAERAQKAKDKTITGQDAFTLYDTYGFPLDLTQLMARERNLKVDTGRFEELMDEQRARARAAQKDASGGINLTGVELPATDDSPKYEASSCISKIVGFIDNQGYNTEGQLTDGAEQIGIVLDKSCFYAEAGGQVGDCGSITSNAGQFVVESTGRIVGCVIHWGCLAEGILSVGEEVEAKVDKGRELSKKNHTATHLLQWALRQVLGKSVGQQGSLVCPEYLRFDFTYPKALSGEEIQKVEGLVRGKITADEPVVAPVMPIAEAQKLGAMALFGEKYGSEVRVVAIGAESLDGIGDAFSREFCGGTHTDRTGRIGGFKIIKEESISAGVRRITAMTGEGLNSFFEQRSDIVDELSTMLKVPSEQLVERIQKLIDENKKLTKELKSARKKGGVDVMAEAKSLLSKAEKVGKTSVIIGRLSAGSAEEGRSAIDMLRKKATSAAIVLGMTNEDKVTLLAGMTDDLVKKGLKAGELVKAVAPIMGGGGGGGPKMAQAGGKNPDKMDEALAKAAEIIKEKLTD